jgi:curved DNA-binding protein CbpA
LQVKQEDKAVAQEKFVEIQQAYEKLSDIKNRRARANKKSEKAPDAQYDEKKVEL